MTLARIQALLAAALLAACSADLAPVLLDTTRQHQLVGGSGPDDLWLTRQDAAFRTEVIHFDGTSLTPVALPATSATLIVRPAGASAIWVMEPWGSALGMLHADGRYDDHSAEVPPGDPATSTSRELAVGGGGAWVQIWSGANPSFFRFANDRFVAVAPPQPTGSSATIVVWGPDEAWWVGQHWTGERWVTHAPPLPNVNAAVFDRAEDESWYAVRTPLGVSRALADTGARAIRPWVLERWNGTALVSLEIAPLAVEPRYEGLGLRLLSGGRIALLCVRITDDQQQSVVANVWDGATLGPEEQILELSPVVRFGWGGTLADGTFVVLEYLGSVQSSRGIGDVAPQSPTLATIRFGRI